MRFKRLAALAAFVFVGCSFAGGPPPCDCAADFNGDGTVDGDDLGALLGGWGSPVGDLDGNNFVDGSDLGSLLGLWGPCEESAPPNDFCFNALSIEVPASGTTIVVPFCTKGATSSGPSVSDCGFATEIFNDIWYRVTAPGDGLLTLSTCNTADFDTVIQVLEPCPGFACLCDPIGCNDDTAGCLITSHVVIEVTEDLVYTIRLGGFLGDSGSGTLQITFTPAGSSCTNPIDVGKTFIFGITGTTTDNVQFPTPSCSFGPAISEWVTWTPSFTGPATIDTCDSGTNFDTVIAVWTFVDDNCVGLPVACNDDSNESGCDLPGPGSKSSVQFNAVEGTKYWIQLTGFNGATGNYLLYGF